MRRQTSVSLLVVGSILCCVGDAALLKRADKMIGNTKEARCAHECATCIPVSNTLAHFRCEKKCKAYEDADSFTCTDTNDPDTPDAPPKNKQLLAELDKMNEQRGRFMSDGNYDGIRSMYTEDAMYFADKMVPGMGLEGPTGVIQGMKDFMASNYITKLTNTRDTDTHNYGEDKKLGIVWDNGIGMAFDGQDDLIGTWRYLFIYKRINDELKEYIDVLGI